MKKIIAFLFLGLSTLFAFEELNINNFDKKISNKKVIVDFYSKW